MKKTCPLAYCDNSLVICKLVLRKQRFPVRVWLLVMFRSELSAVIVQLCKRM